MTDHPYLIPTAQLQAAYAALSARRTANGLSDDDMRRHAFLAAALYDRTGQRGRR